MKIVRALILFLCLSTGLLPPARSSAMTAVQTLAWTGAKSNLWDDSGNWVFPDSPLTTARAPIDTDILVFDSHYAQRKTSSNDIPSIHLTGMAFGSGGFFVGGEAVTVDQLAMDTGTLSGVNTISAPLTLGKAAVAVNTISALSTLVINDAVSGTGKLVKQGQGTVTLQADSTYSEGLQVESGTVHLVKRNAAGTGPIVIQNTGNLLLSSDYGGLNNPLQFIEGGTLSLGITPIYFYGPVTLSTTGTNTGIVDVPAGDSLTFYGVLQGTGNLTKVGEGNLILAGSLPNTYTGKITVQAGSLTLQKSADHAAITGELELKAGADATHLTQLVTMNNGQFSSLAQVKTNANSEVHLRGTTQSLQAISGMAGSLIMEEAVGQTALLTLNNPAAVQYYFNNDKVIGQGKIAINGASGSVQGIGYNYYQTAPLFSGPIEVNGPGYFIATGFNSAGPLVVNGGNGEVMYSSRFSSIVGNSGIVTVDPGASASTYPIVGGLILSSPVEFDADLFYVHPYMLEVNGPVSLGGAAFKLLFSPDAFPSFGTPYVLISNDGTDPVSGTFKDLPEGARVAAKQWAGTSNNGFLIHYAGGDGNDITVTRLARSTLQLVAPSTAVFGSQPQLVASLSTTDPVALPTGSPVSFYCGGQLAGSAQFQVGGTGSVQAMLALPTQFTRIGPVQCYAQLPYGEVFDSATSSTVTINFTGKTLFLALLTR